MPMQRPTPLEQVGLIALTVCGMTLVITVLVFGTWLMKTSFE